MSHTASSSRYKSMTYRRCGRSGLKLPAVSLGLWHNFGSVDSRSTARDLIVRAFDLGVTHFDLANNYGPPPGSAEETFGRIIKECLASHRDELIISTKAGHPMWEGPYGKGGSKKASHGEPGPEPGTHGAGLCGHFLPPLPRLRNPDRRVDAGIGCHRPVR